MKITKEIHKMWGEWSNFPKELLDKMPIKNCIVGKWHYKYENKNGTIGLIRIQSGVAWIESGWRSDMMVWEACGVLEFTRYPTKKAAEVEIYKALKEQMPA